MEEKIEIQKNKEELIAENEAMKDTLAVVLAQKRNVGQANKKLREENQQLKQELDKYKETVQELQENNSKIFDEGLYYRVNYNELKQQLEEKGEQLKEELIEKKGLERALSVCNRQNDEFADMIKKLVNEKERLKQQFAIIEKALELVCEELGNVEVFDKEFMECESFYDYFKTKAKGMLENEK